MAKLILMVAVLVSAAIILGVAGYLVKNKPIKSPQTTSTLTPTPASDETADWRTYRNKEYGFEIKYPKNWVTSVDKAVPFYRFFPPTRESGEISYFDIIVACPTFKEQGFDNLKDYLQFNLTRDSGDETLKVKDDVIVNEITGYKTIT